MYKVENVILIGSKFKGKENIWIEMLLKFWTNFGLNFFYLIDGRFELLAHRKCIGPNNGTIILDWSSFESTLYVQEQNILLPKKTDGCLILDQSQMTNISNPLFSFALKL